VKLVICIILAALAALFLILAAFVAGGVVSMSGGNWLEPGGLATLAVSWFVYLLPIP
jgi:membrane protein implicated in regulation of membrane protease activity